MEGIIEQQIGNRAWDFYLIALKDSIDELKNFTPNKFESIFDEFHQEVINNESLKNHVRENAILAFATNFFNLYERIGNLEDKVNSEKERGD